LMAMWNIYLYYKISFFRIIFDCPPFEDVYSIDPS
jgi:hypothetical protein